MLKEELQNAKEEKVATQTIADVSGCKPDIAMGALRVFKTIVLYAVLAFVAVKAYRFCYIVLHNLVEDEKWPLAATFQVLQSGWTIDQLSPRLTSALLMSPLTETVIFALSWWITKRLRLAGPVFLVVSAGMFAAYHLVLPEAGTYSIPAAFIAGIFLALVYSEIRNQSNVFVAYVACALSHSLYNGIILLQIVMMSPPAA